MEFAMIKQFVARPRQQRAGPAVGSDVGSAVWVTVGRRLQRRRTELGYSVDRVAHWAEIPAESYASYEKGAPIPAALLAQIADLFGIHLVWFFQGVGQDEAAGDPGDQEDDADKKAGPVVYRVATVEHRIAALVESFRQLDFEGQQHLLAISRELSRTNAGAVRE
jgi:transcriptional regulator with XRE-family HTH domain